MCFLLSGDPRLANQNAAQITTSRAHTLGSHWPDVCNCIEGRSVGEQKLATVGPLHCYDIEAMIESRNWKKEKQIILRLMLHLLGCQKERKKFASSGNRTRAARVAGEHSTTEPTMPAFFSCTIFKSDCSMS